MTFPKEPAVEQAQPRSSRVYAVGTLARVRDGGCLAVDVGDEIAHHQAKHETNQGGPLSAREVERLSTILRMWNGYQPVIDEIVADALADAGPKLRDNTWLRAIFRAAAAEALSGERAATSTLDGFSRVARVQFPEGDLAGRAVPLIRKAVLAARDRVKVQAAARLYAVQALFQMEASDATLDKVRKEFEDHRFGAEYDGDEMVEGDLDLFRALLEGAVASQAKIDQLTDKALVARWPIARIDPTLRALFRAAGAELVQGDTPPRVAITEYVDVAKAFFPEGKEPKFVNAVLDHMARAAQPDAF